MEPLAFSKKNTFCRKQSTVLQSFLSLWLLWSVITAISINDVGSKRRSLKTRPQDDVGFS